LDLNLSSVYGATLRVTIFISSASMNALGFDLV
jgi:hypothetical protein